MARRSNIQKNWPKYLLQWGVLAAIAAFLLGLMPSYDTSAASCAAKAWSFSDLTIFQIVIGILLAVATILFSRLFCGLLCPVGTAQDLLIRLRNFLKIKSVKIRNGSVADKFLRIIKYIILFLLFYAAAEVAGLFTGQAGAGSSVNVSPDYNIALWLVFVSICVVIVGGFVIDMFWCRYICPLGAISNSLKFWVWIIGTTAIWLIINIIWGSAPWIILWAAVCFICYLLEIFHARPSFQIIHVTKSEFPCNNCGQCVKNCPYHIDLRSFNNGMINHVDCTLCGECIASCPVGALNIGANKPTKSKLWRFLPPVLTILLIIFGIWASRRLEITPADINNMFEKRCDSTCVINVEPATPQP